MHRLHEIKVMVVAEHSRPQLRLHAPAGQQLNKGPRRNNKKEIRTCMIKTQERIEIINKDHMQAEITLMTVDQTALATVHSAALRQQKAFSSHERRINKDSTQCLLNRNSRNRPLACQSCQDKRSCRKNSKGLKLKH